MTNKETSMIYVVSIDYPFEGYSAPLMAFTSEAAATEYAEKRSLDESQGFTDFYVVTPVELR